MFKTKAAFTCVKVISNLEAASLAHKAKSVEEKKLLQDSQLERNMVSLNDKKGQECATSYTASESPSVVEKSQKTCEFLTNDFIKVKKTEKIFHPN